jgi:hypothetical protein
MPAITIAPNTDNQMSDGAERAEPPAPVRGAPNGNGEVPVVSDGVLEGPTLAMTVGVVTGDVDVVVGLVVVAGVPAVVVAVVVVVVVDVDAGTDIVVVAGTVVVAVVVVVVARRVVVVVGTAVVEVVVVGTVLVVVVVAGTVVVVVAVVVVVGAVVVVVVVGGDTEHVGTVMTLVSRVTAPLIASARPVSDAPETSVIDCDARIVPAKAVPEPMVANDPTCQNTLHAWASFSNTTELAVPVVSDDPA